jgi:plastocyanin
MVAPKRHARRREITLFSAILSFRRGVGFQARTEAPAKWRARRSGLLGTLLILAFAGPADASTIKGKVSGFEHLLNPVWNASKAANAQSYNFREPSPTVSSDLRRLFPYIPKELCVALLAATDQPKMKPVDVLVGGGRTTPVTLVVTPGTELHFKNTDPFPHKLYGVDVKSFGPSDMAKGADRVWTVPEAGVYEIKDELVPSVHMWVVSEPKAAAYGFPDLNGQFQIDVEPLGDYAVQPYFTGKPVGKPLTAPIAKEGVVIDLSKAPIVVGTKSKEASKD